MQVIKMTLLASSMLAPFAAYALNTFGAPSNFDVVNDSGDETHGFEIELDDISSADVVYGFSGTRYGRPIITDDHSDPAHPNKVFVRWLSPYDQTNHVFTKTTQIAPAGFVNRGGNACYGSSAAYLNSGCEHFGVSIRRIPSKTIYAWLKEDPANPGTLRGNAPIPASAIPSPPPPPVSIPQPVWTVQPQGPGAQPIVTATIPVPARPPAASIPVPVTPEGQEFGVAAWAKVLETESADPVELNDLLSDSARVPGNATGINPPNTVTEFEWQILQTDTRNPGADELGISKPLGSGHDNVTRRYEFYKYVGPYDVLDSDGAYASNEALCSSVGPDGIHGVAGKAFSTNIPGASGGIQLWEGDCGDQVVVGDYIGSQMAGVNIDAALAANNPDLPDGEVGVRYPDRPLVFGGSGVFDIQFTGGSLPNGAPPFGLDASGLLTGGVPQAPGAATFSVQASDPIQAKTVNATFNINIVDAVKVDTVAIPQGVKNVNTTVLLTASNGISPFYWSAVPSTTGLTASISGGNNLVLRATTGGTKQVQVKVIDSLGGTHTRTLNYVVPGTVAEDTDQDGVFNTADNCKLVANTDQRDTDGDGYGNICDPDLNGNLLVNLADLALFRARLNTTDANADFNGDGIVNQADQTILKSYFNKVPGPSGLHP